MLYDIPLLLIYFICSSLYLLISCPFICPSPFLLFFGKRKFFLFVSQFLFYTYFHLYYFLIFIYLIFFFFGLFRAVLLAYGGSQARGWIGAVAGLYHSHSNARSKPCLQPAPELSATLDLNPLSKARDRTRTHMVPSWILFCCAMMGTPVLLFRVHI